MIHLIKSDLTEQYYLMLSQANSGLVPVSVDNIKTDMQLIVHDTNVNYFLYCEDVNFVTQFETEEEILEYMIKTNYQSVMFWGYLDQKVKDTLKGWL